MVNNCVSGPTTNKRRVKNFSSAFLYSIGCKLCAKTTIFNTILLDFNESYAKMCFFDNIEDRQDFAGRPCWI